MFKTPFKPFACVGDTITCEVDGFTVTATLYRDDTGDKPDQRDDGFWPSQDKDAAGYVAPENFESEMAKAKRVMTAWQNDEWFFCGVAVTVSKNEVPLTDEFACALWGIECNYPDGDNSYLTEVATELSGEAISQARATLAKLCDSVQREFNK